MTSIFSCIRRAALTAGILFAAVAHGKAPQVAESALHADDSQKRATEIILHVIDTYHYKKRPLDDALSARILDNYLESLDPNRSFFLLSDVQSFDRYRSSLDDGLRAPELSPAFDIFVRYRQRVAERVDFAVAQLRNSYDFGIQENFHFDRRDQQWADSEAALEEYWRKRVKNDALNLKIAGREPDQIRDVLTKRYTRLKTSTFQLNASDVFQSFINAYTTAVEPHTNYFSPRTSENFDISMRLSLEGIGAVLRGDGDYTAVQSVVPGGPADLSNLLHEKDKIVGVAQDADGEMVDVIGWRLDDVVDMIRGPKDSTVRLEILPAGTGIDGKSRVISLVRDKIKLEEQAAQSKVIDFPGQGRIGVIDVPTFYSDFAAQARGDSNYTSTSRDVRRLIKELEQQNIDGLLIDLRGNGGGSLSEALELSGLFIESGPIVQTKDAGGRIEVNSDPDPGIVYGGPLAVLVDRNSASASEIFAGAIQDYRRGIIIGEPTFGKGTVQNIVDLNRFVRNGGADLGRLKTTIAQFYRISGGSNQFKGVVPDVVFPTAKLGEDSGERSLDNALPWDQVEPARFVPASAPVSSFDEVRRRHEARIRDDRAFSLLMEELRLLRDANERTTVSLNEQQRRSERTALLLAQRKVENELRVAQGLQPLTEQVSLDAEPEEDADSGAADDDDDRFDPGKVLLQESVQILLDLILPAHRTAGINPAARPPAAAEKAGNNL
ncbi:MAG: carboxy terminal-processing peptidase [Gammaproteobacteria bacterium]|nr:carboxy terminal-processing peptidase [Gammaproteobacteria bacterium]